MAVSQPLLEVEGLVKHFPGPSNLLQQSSVLVKAVDGKRLDPVNISPINHPNF